MHLELVNLHITITRVFIVLVLKITLSIMVKVKDHTKLELYLGIKKLLVLSVESGSNIQILVKLK
ncbi:MAG: hypothetical protein PHC75_05845 [Burkholderiales bacterium]|nr:hypothetical protein [Burkholderiales bacterium]